MNNFTSNYYIEVNKRLEKIHSMQQENINTAAKLLYDAECNGNKIYTFGTGHSHLIGQELYARAGGYAKIYPILETELTLLTHPTKSTHIERMVEYADILEILYDIKAGDVVIASSNSGRNALVIEYMMRLKRRGVQIIAITSLTHSSQIASRHESGLRLFEVADVTIDNYAPYGDATTKLDENIKMGPVSTITSCFISQLIVGNFVEILVKHQHDAPVFKSSNMDGADAYNEFLFKQYVFKK